MSENRKLTYNTTYPSVERLRQKSRKRMPRFVFDYLEGGCNEEVNLQKNTSEIRKVELAPQYLTKPFNASMRTELFGHTYDAPFGISPVGLQGFMWPNSSEILARASLLHNIPFILSTVTTSNIERAAELTDGMAWFQLYHPTDISVRDDILNRAETAGISVLVLTCDLPVAAFRPRDIRNGVTMPPKMSPQNILQMLLHPAWLLRTMQFGFPEFEVLKPYMPKKLTLKETGAFMENILSTRMDESKVAAIRERWKGKLVLKGISSEADADMAMRLGVDGIIVSNHGGRQLDAGESAINSMTRIAKLYGSKMTIMIDSGIQSGPDIARVLASGAQFAFLGRSFMYGVCALGDAGGSHTISLLKHQLEQVMEQIGCSTPKDLPNFLHQNT